MTALDTIDRETGCEPVGLAVRALRALLPSPTAGTLRIVTPEGETVDIAGRTTGVDAAVVIERWRAIWRLVRGGEVGLQGHHRRFLGHLAQPLADLQALADQRHRRPVARAQDGQGRFV